MATIHSFSPAAAKSLGMASTVGNKVYEVTQWLGKQISQLGRTGQEILIKTWTAFKDAAIALGGYMQKGYDVSSQWIGRNYTVARQFLAAHPQEVKLVAITAAATLLVTFLGWALCGRNSEAAPAPAPAKI